MPATATSITDNTVLTDHVSVRYSDLYKQLLQHPLNTAVADLQDLRIFMQHHVYAVWDFMSIIKSLQQHIAPSHHPWCPSRQPEQVNFINQLVLEEESDVIFPNQSPCFHASHFESYCQAMNEIGADTQAVTLFLDIVAINGLDEALNFEIIPSPCNRFIRDTFEILNSDQPHLVAALLAYGREALIPSIFQAFLNGIDIPLESAPTLHAYLERHIELDKNSHTPIAISLVEQLCAKSKIRITQSILVAERALQSRLTFWDAIYDCLKKDEGLKPL